MEDETKFSDHSVIRYPIIFKDFLNEYKNNTNIFFFLGQPCSLWNLFPDLGLNLRHGSESTES